MNIKEWKKFSDLVDKENLKRYMDAVSATEAATEEQRKEVDEWNKTHKDLWNKRYLTPIIYRAIYIEKTEVNFWEWKAGKLKL